MHQRFLQRTLAVYHQQKIAGTEKEWIQNHVHKKLNQMERQQLARLVRKPLRNN
jgi:hypothetical protein